MKINKNIHIRKKGPGAGKARRNPRKIILNYCFTCKRGFSTPESLNKHFRTPAHNKKFNKRHLPRINTIRVYGTAPTSWGEEKENIKLFSDKNLANKYFDKLVIDYTEAAKGTDDDLSVIMEDMKTGNHIRDKYFNS